MAGSAGRIRCSAVHPWSSGALQQLEGGGKEKEVLEAEWRACIKGDGIIPMPISADGHVR